MTRDEIYDHLAQVYLGKRKQADDKNKKQFNAWLFINICITIVIFASAFYGLTAFLTQKRTFLENSIIFSLHNGPINLEYNFQESEQPTKIFSLSVTQINAAKYGKVQFSVRAKEEGSPGIIKVLLKNDKNETASYYIQGVDLSWQEYSIPFEEFQQITDWSNLTEVSFVLESWNVEKEKGLILIDDVRFSS